MISDDNSFIVSLSYYYELLTCGTVEVCNDRSRKITSFRWKVEKVPLSHHNSH